MAYGMKKARKPATRNKTKRQGVRRGMKPKAHQKPAEDIRKQAGATYADIINQAAEKKKKEMV